MAPKMTLILGGARSGKSAYAEQLAARHGGQVVYVATAEPVDADMQARIARHRQQRPSGWHTVEAPRDVGTAVAQHVSEAGVILLDCVTLLVTNLIVTLDEVYDPDAVDLDKAQAAVDAELDALLAAFESGQTDWIVVSNEVGLGVVPSYPVARVYRDVLGRANQRLAARADVVYLLAAGLPLQLKGA